MRIMPFMKRKKGVQFAGTGFDIGGGGTTDYTDLSNKPQIAGVTLTGNKTLADLGAQSALTFDDTPTANSSNPVKSGGVASALSSINSKLDFNTIIDCSSNITVSSTCMTNVTLKSAYRIGNLLFINVSGKLTSVWYGYLLYISGPFYSAHGLGMASLMYTKDDQTRSNYASTVINDPQSGFSIYFVRDTPGAGSEYEAQLNAIIVLTDTQV